MNTALLVLKSFLLLLLVFCSALYSGTETSLFSLNAMQLQQFKKAGGCYAHIAALMRTPAKILSTILIGNTLVNCLIPVVALAIIGTFDLPETTSVVISIVCITPTLILFGELAPKRIAVRHPEAFARFISCPLYICYIVFTPLRFLLEFITNKLKGLLTPERTSLSDAELQTAIEISEETGTLDSNEKKMASGIMQLAEMRASDIMTPRVDFIGLDLDEPQESFDAVIRSSEYHYLPIYTNTPDEIEAFLDVRAYLLDPEHDFEKAQKRPIFVPEAATLDDILITMQRSGQRVVCVMDEYGGTAGLLTRGDILEVITGVIPEADEKLEEDIVAVGENRWIIDGDTSIEEVNHTLELDLDTEDADRISGWVIAQAGRFLRTGESVEAEGCRVKVLKHRKLRIISVELELLAKNDEEEKGEE